MLRVLVLCCALGVAVHPLAAEADPPPVDAASAVVADPALTEAISTALAARKGSLTLAQMDYITAVNQRTQDALDALQRELATVMKREDLDGAVVLKAWIAHLEASLPKTDILGKLVDEAPVDKGAGTAATALPPPPTPAIERILDNRDRLQEKTQDAYLRQAAVADGKLLDVYAGEFSAAMKAEQLELAIAIKQAIAEVATKREHAVFLGISLDPPPTTPVTTRLTAQPWTSRIATKEYGFTFQPDGSVTMEGSDTAGRWWEDLARRRIAIAWSEVVVKDYVLPDLDAPGWTLRKTGNGDYELKPKVTAEEEREVPRFPRGRGSRGGRRR